MNELESPTGAEGLSQAFLATTVSFLRPPLLLWIQVLSSDASETQVIGLVNLAWSPFICSEKLHHMVEKTKA